MTLSRKEFFRKGFFALGDGLLKAAGVVQQGQLQPESDLPEEMHHGDQPMLAVARNDRCLAKNCGCFSCVERCDAQAITVVMGEGIRIDETRCTGCGTCLYVCPVTPKAVGLRVRHQECR